jgi:hypothetical protein
MASKTRNPATRAACRAPEMFNCLAALNSPEIAQPLIKIQAQYLSRLYKLDPRRAELLAGFAFDSGRRA